MCANGAALSHTQCSGLLLKLLPLVALTSLCALQVSPRRLNAVCTTAKRGTHSKQEEKGNKFLPTKRSGMEDNCCRSQARRNSSISRTYSLAVRLSFICTLIQTSCVPRTWTRVSRWREQLESGQSLQLNDQLSRSAARAELVVVVLCWLLSRQPRAIHLLLSRPGWWPTRLI